VNIRVIHTENDYQTALSRIDHLMDASHGSQAGDELELLVALTELYERQVHPIDAPDPVEFIKNVMEFTGKTQKDLAELLTSRSRASELLNRKRSLTLENIRAISRGWNIPVDPLIQEYTIA